MAQQIKIELTVDDKGTATLNNFAGNATASLDKVNRSTVDLSGGFAKTWAGITTGGAAAIYLFKEIAGAIEAPIDAYMESEKALLKMGMAMKNQGDFSAAALEDMEAYAKHIQRTTAYEDDFTLSVMGNLKSFGMTNEEVKKATLVALDFATAKETEGMTVERASELLGKAYLGNVTALKKVGIQIDDTIPKSQQFAAVMDQLQARFGGSAQAELLTYAGQWKQIKNQYQDVQEFLGLVFLKTIESLEFVFMMASAGFWKFVEAQLSGWGQIVGGFGNVLQWIGKLVPGFDYLGKNVNAVSGAMLDGAENARGASAEAIKLANNAFNNVTAFNKTTRAIENMGIQGKSTIKTMDDDLKGQIKTQTEYLKALEAEYKSTYESAIQAAENAAKMQQLAGRNELDVITDLYDRKETLLNDWYDKQAALIEEQVKNEAKGAKAGFDVKKVTQERLNALYADYNGKWDMAEAKRVESAAEYARKRITTEAGLYKTINQYSDESVAAEIAALDQKYKELGRYTKNATLLEQAKAAEKFNILQNQLKAKADYYGNIKGYEETSFLLMSEYIDKEAGKKAKLWKDDVAAAQWAYEQKAEYYIRIAQKSDDWVAGVKAGLLALEIRQQTWGQTSFDIVKKFSDDATGQLSDNLFLFLKGEWSDMKFDFGTILDDMLKILTKKISEMIVQWGMYQAAAMVGLNIGGVPNIAGSGAGGMANAAGSAAGSLTSGGGLIGRAGDFYTVLTNGGSVSDAFGVATSGLGMGSAVTAGALGLAAGAGLGALGANLTGGDTTAGAVGGAMAGLILPGIGNVIGGMIGGAIGGLFGGHAGYGSAATLKDTGKYGELPTFGAWAELPRSSGPASAELISYIESGVTAAVRHAYQVENAVIAAMPGPYQQQVKMVLANAKFKFLPDHPGVVNNNTIALDRKSTRLNSSHIQKSRMPSSA